MVRDGPYRLVRHAGYLASLALWAGFGLAVGNWWAALSIDLALAVVYPRRIDAEASMLLAAIGEPYAAYRRETARLLPDVY